MNSKIRQTTDSGTIQGGKMSGILYSIYTSEIPQLYRLLDTPLYTEITGNVPLRPDKDTIHENFNFVDDSMNAIVFQSSNNIQLYIYKFYLLLHNYQLINKLCINSDKTQLMICHKAKHNDFLKDFFFMAKDDKIENSNSLKILGFVLRYNLDYETQIGNLCASLHNR